MGPFTRQDGVEWNVSSRQGLPKRIQFRFCTHTQQFEQIAESPGHRARLEACGVLDEFLRAQIGTAHPESLGNFGDPSTVFRLPQSVEDSAFEIAYFNRLFFRDPMLHGAKEV